MTVFIIGLVFLAISLVFFAYSLRGRKDHAAVILDRLQAQENKDEARARVSDQLLQKNQFELQRNLIKQINHHQLQLQSQLNQFKTNFDQHQLTSLKTLQESLQTSLKAAREEIGLRVNQLTESTNLRLKEISGQVEKRLYEGFEKTTQAFSDVVKRLAMIDEAQKKITELSNNVVSLQEVLSDKRSRGVFGEVQLASLVRNVLPEAHFSLQHTLSNGKRVDCLLFLPAPTGNLAIDAKFPLESYQTMTDFKQSDEVRSNAQRQFKKDILKHIHDISSKYILHNETCDGAMMFIPAESVFSEIHAHYPDLISQAYKAKVWLVSPTTLMAVLTTARAVLKDEATKQQVHLIREHLVNLAQDFNRFQKRMDALSRHIAQAHEDVVQVNTSAKKITSRFEKIESVQLKREETESIVS
jgi:DNA recombination protein RmuC